MTQPDDPQQQYLYAIIACREPRTFKALGIGERGDPVHTVHHGRLAAVISASAQSEYDNSRRNMMAHTLVLEEVMAEFDLLPVRFGTVAPDVRAVERLLLEARYDEFTHLLGQMANRIELGLKAFWYEDAVFEEIVTENDAIRRLRDALDGRSPDETYYERIRLGEAVEKALADKRAHDEEAILSRLRPHVLKTRTNKTISDRMVLNAAFLVDADREPEVDAAVRALDAELGERLMFKYVGPVPPYNFVDIVVSWDARGAA